MGCQGALAKVDEADAPIVEDKDVARVRVRMEEAELEDRPSECLGER